MLNALESGLIIAGSVAFGLLLLWQLHRVWPPQARKLHNDLIGWQIGFLATSYGVIVAFMLSGVWQAYQAAETNTEMEANSLIILHRIADGVSAGPCAELKSLTHRYANAMITDEWPGMDKGLPLDRGALLLHSMWKVVLQVQPQTPGETAFLGRIITEMANLAEHYRIRQYQSRSQLPGLFWLVLISGGAITVAYTCLLGVESRGVHVIQVVTTALTVSLVLVAIADVDQPFRGAIHISSDPFRTALKVFDMPP